MVNKTTSILIGSWFGMLLAIAPASAVDFEVKEGWIATLRGFVAVRADYDQNNMGGSEPLFPPRDGSAQDGDHTFRFSASQTQLGFGLKGPSKNGLTNRGYIEIDFLNERISGLDDRGNTTSPRLRHAYFELGWNDGKSALTVGQTNVLFGDTLPDLTFDNLNLALGSLFGRESQVRYTHKQTLKSGSDITYGISINAPNSGLFNEATDTAERTGRPFIHGKIAYHTDAWGKVDYFGFERGAPVPAEFALSSFIGQERIDRTAPGTSGKEDVNAFGIAASFHLPIIGIRDDQRKGAISVTGQAWYGENMDSYFGGNGQGVFETVDGKVDGIKTKGFFVGGKYFLTDHMWLNAIYSYEKNDLLKDAGNQFRIASGLFRDSTFGKPGVEKAQTINLTWWYEPIPALYVGLGWDYRKATYNDGVKGDNNRLSASMFYNF